MAAGTGLAEALRGIDIVIHLAGVTKARTPADYDRGNVVATANVLRAAGDVERFVHVSSLAAAGPSTALRPLTEADAPRPISHYGRSKLAGEEAVRKSGIAERSVIVRPPVVYGPRDRDVLQVLSTISHGWMVEVGQALCLRRPRRPPVARSDDTKMAAYEAAAGRVPAPRRFSHIYVGDLVDGLIAAADCASAAGRTFYLADPAPVSWGEFGSTAARLMNRHVRTLEIPEQAAFALGWCAEAWSRLSGKPGILSRDKVLEACCDGWVCDPDRACRELGFCARISLEEGLRRTLAWYKEAGWLKF